MITKRTSGLLVVFSICMVVGCADSRRAQGQELQSWVKHLTPMIVGVCMADENHQIADDKLLDEAVKNKPKYQAFFKKYCVKVKRQNTDVVVLVCSKDGSYALREDASWTNDKKFHIDWSSTRKPQPPEFTLKFPNKPTLPPGKGS